MLHTSEPIYYGEVVLRQRSCRRCQAVFWICQHCDHGQRYYSAFCRVLARRQSHRSRICVQTLLDGVAEGIGRTASAPSLLCAVRTARIFRRSVSQNSTLLGCRDDQRRALCADSSTGAGRSCRSRPAQTGETIACLQHQKLKAHGQFRMELTHQDRARHHQTRPHTGLPQ